MRAVHYFVRQMLQRTRLTWGGVMVVVGRWLRACVVGQLDGRKSSREPGTWHLAPPWGAWKGVVNESGIPNIA